MPDTSELIVATSPPAAQTYVDWNSVLGGALVASALSFVLFAFGSGAGLLSVSPYSWNNPSGTTLSILAVAWFVFVMMNSFLAGGYFAGRMGRSIPDAKVDEIERRDGAQGLVMWALALLLGATLAFMTIGSTARSVVGAAGQAGGAAAGSAVANLSGDQVSGFVDTMLRAPAGATPAQSDDPRQEITRVFSNSISRGQVTEADRAYVAQLIARRTGIAEDEARRRVDTAIEGAKAAANKARKTAATIAFLIALSSLLAAGAAYWGAMWGGRHRDQERLGTPVSMWS
jgi:hypothetical protein